MSFVKLRKPPPLRAIHEDNIGEDVYTRSASTERNLLCAYTGNEFLIAGEFITNGHNESFPLYVYNERPNFEQSYPLLTCLK